MSAGDLVAFRAQLRIDVETYDRTLTGYIGGELDRDAVDRAARQLADVVLTYRDLVAELIERAIAERNPPDGPKS